MSDQEKRTFQLDVGVKVRIINPENPLDRIPVWTVSDLGEDDVEVEIISGYVGAPTVRVTREVEPDNLIPISETDFLEFKGGI